MGQQKAERAWSSPATDSPMLYFCCTSRTICVLADLRKMPSVVRAGGQCGLMRLGALAQGQRWGGARLDSSSLGWVGALTMGLQVGDCLPEDNGDGLLVWALLLEAAGVGVVSGWGGGWGPAHPAGSQGLRPHTHCCSETPNCWLGRGGRGGMGLGAVAGLFCVDFRKSSYLGVGGEGSQTSWPAGSWLSPVCGPPLRCLTKTIPFNPLTVLAVSTGDNNDFKDWLGNLQMAEVILALFT